MTQFMKCESVRFGIIFCISLFGILPQSGFSTNFSDVRRSFQKDLAKVYGPNTNHRIAIVYNTANQSQLKYKINLVQFKKDLARELLKSFEVVDPFIVQEIVATNQIAFDQLTEDSFIRSSFADRANCTQILLVDLKKLNASVLVDLKLITPVNDTLSQVVMDLPFESSGSETVESIPLAEPEKESIIDRIASEFTPAMFDEEHNDSWLFFSPTAYINPQVNYFEILTWVDDLARVDLEVVRVRYDIRLMRKLQFGIEANTIQEKKNARSERANTDKNNGIHSSYISIRYQVLDENDLPFAILLGFKGRVYWDKNNTDFVSGDEDIDEKNDDYNKATLFTSLSSRLESVGALLNFYLDNQSFHLGAKLLVTSNIKLFAERIFYHYKKPQVPNDFATGIQAYNSEGFVATISYQKETDQFQFGLSFSF